MDERTRRVGDLAYLIYKQWWRPLKNRQRRAEMAALIAEAEREHTERRRRQAEFRVARERLRQPHGAE